MDTTAHAEIQVIREASHRLKALELTGCVIYSTCEACPMCFTACVWAQVERIVYACRIEDAERVGGLPRRPGGTAQAQIFVNNPSS